MRFMPNLDWFYQGNNIKYYKVILVVFFKQKTTAKIHAVGI